MDDLEKTLDKEIQLLIATGAAVAAGCIPCLKNIVSMALEQGIDKKKLRAAARTGQFIKEKPADLMKACCDDLLGTHLQVNPSASEKGCPMSENADSSTTGAVAGKATGGCGCS